MANTKTPRRMDTKKLTTLGILTAIAYIIMVIGRIPISSVDFLKYDPKDIVIVIGGFIFGPFSAFLMASVVALIEMITVSTTGFWGLLMNILSSCSFACVASYVYRRKQTQAGAVVGLISGALAMVSMMLLWNYFITPIYMGYPREAVAAMLVPVFLPFNLIKSGINAALAMLLYKPIVQTLRKARLVPESSSGHQKTTINAGFIIAAVVVLASCIMAVLAIRGII